MSRPRKPRDLHAYTDKQGALEYLDEVREIIERSSADLFKIRSDIRFWHREWEKPRTTEGRVTRIKTS